MYSSTAVPIRATKHLQLPGVLAWATTVAALVLGARVGSGSMRGHAITGHRCPS